MAITLKAARVNVGLTQKKAAMLLGVSKETISNWERGLYFPDVKNIRRLEKTYGVSYNDLTFLPKNNALSVKKEAT